MAIGEILPKEPTIVEPETGEKPVIKVEPPQESFEAKKHIIRSKQIFWYSWMVIELLLFLRFLLMLFGANHKSLFAVIVDTLSWPLRFIFSGLFPSAVSPVGSIIIEWSTLFAMLTYMLIVFVATRFFKLGKPIDPEEADKNVEKNIP
jgi:hypothetical protein